MGGPVEMKIQDPEMKRGFGAVNFERRTYPRLSIDLPVEYGPLGSFEGRPGRTGDVSEGGLLLYLPKEMEVGQDLWLKLFMGTELELTSIEARGRVVWKDVFGGENDECRRMGVKITDISAGDLCKLQDFLKTMFIKKATPKLDIPSKLLAVLGLSNLKIKDFGD
jgi:c-di-GMP-binding flagellar brake protein YcgR